MAIKLATIKNKNGDVYYPKTTAAQVIRDSSTVDADLAAVEALAAAAIPGSALGAANGVAQLDSSGKVPSSQLPSQALTASDISVADIDAMLALDATTAPLNIDVFVNDASDDPTVGSGWALYRRSATAGDTLSDWTKLMEGEALDVAFVDQEARDAAEAAQEDVTALTSTVNGLGTVYIVDSGADLSVYGDNDLILEVDADE